MPPPRSDDSAAAHPLMETAVAYSLMDGLLNDDNDGPFFMPGLVCFVTAIYVQ